MKGHILVVDDEPEIRRLLREILEEEDYAVATAQTAAQAREALRSQHPDVILLDIWMPDLDGVSLLKEWKTAGLESPVIMISGHGTVETAVEAVRLGAWDYLEKPLTTARLLLAIEHARAAGQLMLENRRLKAREATPRLIGRSPIMQQLRERIAELATADRDVLITGEPGCGRETAARMIFSGSRRAGKPFVLVPLSAIPARLAAVRLFGGTRAGHDEPGAFEAAEGGVLYLDDLAALDPASQLVLSGTLASRRLPGRRQTSPFDVRVIATARAPLGPLAQAGRFHGLLAEHLGGPLACPSLHEHSEDIPELVQHIVDHLVETEHLPWRRFRTGALNLMRQHPWPGNVSELSNFVQRLLIQNLGRDVEGEETAHALSLTPRDASPFDTAHFDLPLREAREHFERAYLEYHLIQSGGRMGEVARLCGIERTHLYRKLRKLGLAEKRKQPEPGQN